MGFSQRFTPVPSAGATGRAQMNVDRFTKKLQILFLEVFMKLNCNDSGG
jgi:hypothetical protein